MFRPLCLICALAVAPLPALADGVISLSLTPRTAEEASLMRLGLGLYALRQDLRDGATLRQIGQGNAAQILQSGGGNWGLVQQRGNGHQASLVQTGGGNAQAIFQSGKTTTATVTQGGGQVGILLQYGY